MNSITYCPENIINLSHLYVKILVCPIASMLMDSRAFDCLTSFYLFFVLFAFLFLSRTHFYMELSHGWVNSGTDSNNATAIAKSTLKTFYPDLGEIRIHFSISF